MTPLPPDESEIRARLERVGAAIRDQGLDWYLCHDPANIFYLTNFANYVHERPFIFLVPARGTPVFIMPRLEAPHVGSRIVGNAEFLQYAEFPAPPGRQWSDRLRDILLAGHRVGLESSCPASVSGAVPGSTVVTDVVDEIRMVKSPYELDRIAYTCDLVSRGHERFLAGVRPGWMIVELHSEIGKALTKKLLLDNPHTNMLNTRFAAIAQPPGISHDPHNFTDVFMRFEPGGPHVSIVNGLANGYGAEVERTFFIGRVPEAARQPFDDMLAARSLALDLVRSGQLMSGVDRKVNDFLRSRGYGDHLLHRTGHSFGVTDHEAPFLAEGYDRVIEPDMVFSVEPGIYIPGTGGFRFSDTVRVTADGNRVLTRAPESLADLTLARGSRIRDTLKSWMISRLTR